MDGDEDHFNQLSSISRLEILEKFPALNIFQDGKELTTEANPCKCKHAKMSRLELASNYECDTCHDKAFNSEWHAQNEFHFHHRKWEFLKKFIQHYESLQKSGYGPPSFTEMLQTLCQELNCELLSSLEFITVSKLAVEFGESCSFFLSLGSAAEGNSLSPFPDIAENINKPTTHLLEKKFLLIARLTQSISIPDLSSRKNPSSFLFLSDGSSKIPCLIKASLCDEMLLLLNEWILIVNANFICSSKFPGILEICSKPIPLRVSCLFSRNPVCTLDVKSAFTFLHKREKFKPKEICVTGFVSAISEVVEIKQSVIVLVELCHHEDNTYSCHILLKENFLHWQHLLNPGTCYVFSALKISTFTKGCGFSPLNIFVPCHTCKIWPQKYCQLQKQEIKDLLLDEFKEEELDFPTEKKVSNLTSYKGFITDTNQATCGVYILNHQVRLHLCYVPLVNDFSHLRVGCFIQVHNVHVKEYSEEVPKIQLFCCMRTCIKVLEFSSVNTPPVLLNVNWAQVMAFSHSTNVNWLLEVRNWLNSNSSLLGIKQIDFIWNSFLLSTLNETTEMSKQPRRNLLQEFFSSYHNCPIVMERSCSNAKMSFPSAVCPSNLLEEDFSNLIKEQKQQSIYKTSTNMEEDFWEPFVKNIQGTKMLIGYMALSSESGRLCLTDCLNSLNILCQPWQMDPSSDSLSHICTARCLLEQKKTKLVFPCPFAHSWCLGRLIIVNKYQMVLEKFINGSNTENWIKYVQFSLEDIVVLNSSVLPNFSPKFGLNFNCIESTDNDNIYTCQMFMFLHKQSLMGHNLSSENPALRFTASGYYLGNAFQLPVKNVFRYLTKFPKSEELQNATFNLENICKKDPIDGNHYYRVVLQFENTQAQWYDLLQNVGSCYMLVVKGNNLNVFKSTIAPSVEKALRESSSKCPVQMPQNVFVQELSDWHFHTIYKTKQNTLLNLKKIVLMQISSHNSPAYSVSDIISHSFSESIVSLLPTVILSRTHPQNKYSAYGSRDANFTDSIMDPFNTELELSTFVGKSITLVLKEIKSNEELVLFMNLENTSYPLGLLEGAVVEFHLLQRKVSKNNKVYCIFIATSSVRVLATAYNGILDINSRVCSSHLSGHDSAMNRMSRMNCHDQWGSLSLMLNEFYSERNYLWTHAFVSQVTKLTVRTVCTKCSSISFCHKCSDKTCSNTQFHVSVYICVLLDDGSCTAYAFSWQEDLLRKILGLSPTQWKDCVYLIHSKHGEICLQPKLTCSVISEETSVHRFLSTLCDSSLVKKKWWLKLKRKTNFASSLREDRFPYQEIGFVKSFGKIQTKCFPFLQVQILSIQHDSPFDILPICLH